MIKRHVTLKFFHFKYRAFILSQVYIYRILCSLLSRGVQRAHRRIANESDSMHFNVVVVLDRTTFYYIIYFILFFPYKRVQERTQSKAFEVDVAFLVCHLMLIQFEKNCEWNFYFDILVMSFRLICFGNFARVLIKSFFG